MLSLLVLSLPPVGIASAAGTDPAWRGEYFANQDLSGAPSFTRSDPTLKFNWGWGAPDPRLPADHFSVRWTRGVYFTPGTYRFSALVDDGVRVFVDGKTIIDRWRVTAPITYTSSISLTAGTHAIRVDYYENTERAQAAVWWDQNAIVQVNSAVWQPPVHPGKWEGAYYANPTLSGTPAFLRNDALIYFDWGVGGPGGGLAGRDFSARWSRVVDFPAGRYQFRVTVDDGVRLWFDWAAIIDQWHDSPGQTYTVIKDVKGGKHEIVVEYYQRGGPAQIKLEWQDTAVNWTGTLVSCAGGQKSWVKVYRLAPNNVWEDLRAEGWGPTAAGGEIRLFGLPVATAYGWDGQPYKVELWTNGARIRTEGDVFAGQKVLALQPSGAIQTTWPCGANIPQG
jgi:hypothetical protein